MNIVLLGINGQVGRQLCRSLSPLGTLHLFDRAACDLSAKVDFAALLDHCKPDVIVNASAYTAVDKAESEADLAFQINATAVEQLAHYAAAKNAWLIHYSTDYVYQGDGDQPQLESQATAPQSVYGKSKLAGEEAIISSGCRHLIFRTSWVYSVSGHNFFKTILRLAGERESLSIVADQIGAPTSAELIADVTALCLYRIVNTPEQGDGYSGVYHLAAAGFTSWHGLATFIVEQALAAGAELAIDIKQIKAIASTDYPTPAQRPLNSRLCTDKLAQRFSLQLPNWQHHAADTITALVEKGR